MSNKRIEHISIGREEIDVHRMGDPSASSLLYAHGLPSSGEEAKVVLANATEHGFQVIAPTRPGYGNSTARVQKTLQRITEDTLRILDRLGIREFYAVGTSAGAKNALSLAHREPDRVTGVSLLAGLPPFENSASRGHLPLGMRLGFTAAKVLPEYAHSFFAWLAGFKVRGARKNPEGEILSYINILPPADQRLLSQPEVFKSFVDIVRDWSRQGTGRGIFGDIVRAAKPWGFDPKDVTKEVQIIHGALDPVVPFNAAKAFEEIPHHEMIALPEGGHAVYAYPEVSQQVIARAKKTFRRE